MSDKSALLTFELPVKDEYVDVPLKLRIVNKSSENDEVSVPNENDLLLTIEMENETVTSVKFNKSIFKKPSSQEREFKPAKKKGLLACCINPKTEGSDIDLIDDGDLIRMNITFLIDLLKTIKIQKSAVEPKSSKGGCCESGGACLQRKSCDPKCTGPCNTKAKCAPACNESCAKEQTCCGLLTIKKDKAKSQVRLLNPAMVERLGFLRRNFLNLYMATLYFKFVYLLFFSE